MNFISFNHISFNEMLQDVDFLQSDELQELGGSITEKKIKNEERRKSIYETVFGVPEILQNILSLASENKPGELTAYRLVDRQWNQNADGLLSSKWSTLKCSLPDELADIKTAMEKVEAKHARSFPLEKCKKLSEKILPSVFMKTKLKDVPLTLAGYQALQNEIKEIQDNALQIIWEKKISVYLENYLRQQGNQAIPQAHLRPSSKATGKEIRAFLNHNEILPFLLRVKFLSLSKLGLTIIPAELGLFTNLEQLDLSSNLITRIENLKNLTRLRGLYLSSNSIAKIENLYKLQELEQLDLSRNLITRIENLYRLQQLERLDLSCNRISKIENLKHLHWLRILNLKENQITEIKNLSNLQFRALDLSYNKITEMKNLSNQQWLQILNLSWNQITKTKNLDKLRNLESLSFIGNPIVNIVDVQKLQSLRTFNGLPFTKQMERANGNNGKRKRDPN